MSPPQLQSSLLSLEEKKLLKLVKKVAKNFARFFKLQLESNASNKKKKMQKISKNLEKPIKKNREYKRIRIKYLPSLIFQSIVKGIPLREPEIKKGSRAEPEKLLFDIQEKFTPDQEFLDFVEKYDLLQQKRKIKEFDDQELLYKPRRIYLQRLDDDNSKLLVKMYVDWGYIFENKLTLFLDDERNKLTINLIRILDENLETLAVFPIRHRSYYIVDDEPTADSLFIGQITNMQINSRYTYRIECYKKTCGTLIAGTDLIEFKTNFNLKEANESIFLVICSDLHGGRNGEFGRGKLKGDNITGNIDLGVVFQEITKNEKLVTFNNGYNLSIATGDLTENASYPEYWSDLLQRTYSLWNHVPLVTSLGNHDYYASGIGRGNILGGFDEDCRFWHRYITNPISCGGCLPGHWYSLDQGNVHLIFLDSNGLGWGKFEINCKSEQWLWLENDLKNLQERRIMDEKAPQFCFVFLHSAIFSCGYWGRGFNWGNDEKVQSYLTPLFKKYGVDVVLFGHDHIYQRSEWMGTNYIVNGRSGGKLRPELVWFKKRVKYNIERSCGDQVTRIYTTVYVPPNSENFNEEEKKKFDIFLDKVRNDLLSQPTEMFYRFGVGVINRRICQRFDNKIKFKQKLIEEHILPKLSSHLWVRAFRIKDDKQIEKPQLFDMVFISLDDKKKYPKDFQINCPENIVK